MVNLTVFYLHAIFIFFYLLKKYVYSGLHKYIIYLFSFDILN